MFEVGDLVRFKPSGVMKSRLSPEKKIGIILEIKRRMFQSYDGVLQDSICVFWVPLNKKESVMEFYLEHVENPCSAN